MATSASPHSEVADILVERVNLTALTQYAGKKIDGRQEELDAYIRRLVAEGVREGDYAAIPIQYYRNSRLGGRRYAKGLAAQKMTREARAAVFSDSAFDVDIANSTPSIMLNLLRELSSLGNYPLLRKYCNHYRSWRAFTAEYSGIPEKDAKISIIKLFYGGLPDVELPFLWALGAEISRATGVILGAEKFRYLQGHLRGRRNPMASRLSYALAAGEDKILMALRESVGRNMEGANISAFMFDGAVISTAAHRRDEIEALLNKVGAANHVTIEIKPF